MKLTEKSATILLALVISARATSFMFSKLCLLTMNAFSLLAIRFAFAAFLLFVVFHKKILSSMSKGNLVSGMIIGSLYFCVLLCEHTGLKTTNASTGSFLENQAIIIVPFMEAVISQRLPKTNAVISAVLAVCGVALLTMVGNQFMFTSGELFLLGAATLYAVAIIVTSRLARKGDSFTIGFVQVTTIGLLSWIFVGITRDFTAPVQASQYLMIAMLAIVCTCFGFTLQPVAQSKLPSETASAFCALSPLIAGLLSVIFLKEAFTLKTLAGALLILISLVIDSVDIPSLIARYRRSGIGGQA